jgi:hypothetical protein
MSRKSHHEIYLLTLAGTVNKKHYQIKKKFTGILVMLISFLKKLSGSVASEKETVKWKTKNDLILFE